MEHAVLSICQGRIAPVFDVSRRALVIHCHAGLVVGQEIRALPHPDADSWVNLLRENDAVNLICGAISQPLQSELRRRGITLFSYVSGDLDAVIQGWLAGELQDRRFAMPGCCGRRFCRGRKNHERGGH